LIALDGAIPKRAAAARQDIPSSTVAGHGERNPAARLVQRNGYRERDWETRAGSFELRIPRLRPAAVC
jgi:transposase-like protein